MGITVLTIRSILTEQTARMLLSAIKWAQAEKENYSVVIFKKR